MNGWQLVVVGFDPLERTQHELVQLGPEGELRVRDMDLEAELAAARLSDEMSPQLLVLATLKAEMEGGRKLEELLYEQAQELQEGLRGLARTVLDRKPRKVGALNAAVLAKEYSVMVTTVPRLPATVVEWLAGQGSIHLAVALAESRCLTGEASRTLFRRASGPDMERVVQALLTNPVVPLEQKLRAVESSARLREWCSVNARQLPPQLQKELLRWPELRSNVVASGDLPDQILEELVQDPDPLVRQMVARRCGPGSAEKLASDPESHVRLSVIHNPRLPKRMLKALLKDEVEGVRHAAEIESRGGTYL